MSLFLLDTDHPSLYQYGHPGVVQSVLAHLGDERAISVITVEEQLTGWQRLLGRSRDQDQRAEVYRRMALAAGAGRGAVRVEWAFPAIESPNPDGVLVGGTARRYNSRTGQTKASCRSRGGGLPDGAGATAAPGRGRAWRGVRLSWSRR